MAGLVKRTLVAAAGVVLGMALVAGFGSLRHRAARDVEPRAPAPLKGETAPGDRA